VLTRFLKWFACPTASAQGAARRGQANNFNSLHAGPWRRSVTSSLVGVRWSVLAAQSEANAKRGQQ